MSAPVLTPRTPLLHLLLAVAMVVPAFGLDGAAVGPGAPALWAGLVPGPDRVGYRRLDTPRGVVHAWYPASAGGVALRLRDYLRDDAAGLSAFLVKTGVSAPTVDRFLASPLLAVASAPARDRRSPLVLVAHGNGQDVADQVVLCEYLASQGFVVAATPSPMRRTPMEREDQVGTLAEEQSADLSAAIAVMAAALPVDTAHLAVVGHSFGARAGLLVAMRDPRVRALVSLDGGIGTATALEPFRRAPSFRADAPLPALLHFYEELDDFMAPDFAFLEALHTAGLQLRPTTGMHHGHFTTYGFAAAVFPDLAAVTHATPETGAGAIAVATETAAFLRRHVR